MPVNDIIRESDYNNIRNKLVNIMGTGSADSGWGQTSKIQSSAVAVGSPVSISDWGKLRYDIINAYVHIFGTTPTTAQVLEGYPVRYSNTFVPDTGPSPGSPTKTDSPVTQYNAWVDTIIANKFGLGAGQSSTTAAVSNSFTGSWSNSLSCVVEVKFANANDARYFFNSGGQVRFTSSKTNNTLTAQNTTWASLLTSAGTRSFGGNSPSTGNSPSNGQNWYRMTQIDQVWSTISGSSPYGSNTYRISSRSNVASNTTGTANIGYFLVQFLDGYSDPGPPLPGDAVDGTFTVSVDCLHPTGILVPTGAGNFAVPLPTITISGFTAS